MTIRDTAELESMIPLATKESSNIQLADRSGRRKSNIGTANERYTAINRYQDERFKRIENRQSKLTEDAKNTHDMAQQALGGAGGAIMDSRADTGIGTFNGSVSDGSIDVRFGANSFAISRQFFLPADFRYPFTMYRRGNTIGFLVGDAAETNALMGDTTNPKLVFYKGAFLPIQSWPTDGRVDVENDITPVAQNIFFIEIDFSASTATWSNGDLSDSSTYASNPGTGIVRWPIARVDWDSENTRITYICQFWTGIIPIWW